MNMDTYSPDPAAPSEPPPEGYRTDAAEAYLPAIESEGLLPAVMAVEELLASQTKAGQGRWRSLTAADLITHLQDHLDEVALDLESADPETGHPTAAHVAARALMLLALALETRR